MASNKTLKLKFIMAVEEYNQYWGKKVNQLKLIQNEHRVKLVDKDIKSDIITVFCMFKNPEEIFKIERHKKIF